MADRYWVGTTSEDWHDIRNWSTTSGGSPGASIPGADDTAYFDFNSGTHICTISSSINIGNINMTGFHSYLYAQNINIISTGEIIIEASSVDFYYANITCSKFKVLRLSDFSAIDGLQITVSEEFIIHYYSGSYFLPTDSLILNCIGDVTYTREDIYTDSGPSVGILTLNSGCTLSVTGTASRFGRLLLEPGSTIKFKEGSVHRIISYVDGDWDGTSENLVTISSITNGIRHNLTVPSSIEVSYVSVRDSIVSNNIDADDGTCINGGNNAGWLFGDSRINIFPMFLMHSGKSSLI